MKKSFLRMITLLGILIPCILNARSTTIVLGPEVKVSNDSDTLAHVETAVAVNPHDPNHLLACSMIVNAGAYEDARSYASFDGGSTWAFAQPQIMQWDPLVAFGTTGTPYFIGMGPGGARDTYVCLSDNGGRSWNPSFLVHPGSDDSPRIIADRTGGAYNGRTYIVYGPGSLHILRSDDDARTFTESFKKSQGGGSMVAENPLMFSDGTLLIPYYVRHLTYDDYWTIRSSDGGTTFTGEKLVYKSMHGEALRGVGRAVFGVGPYLGKERLYVVWASAKDGPNSQLRIMYSDDRGETWSAPKAVVPGVVPSDIHGLCAVMVNPEGTVGVYWVQWAQASWNGVATSSFDIYFTASADGGDTFRPAVRLTPTATRPTADYAGRHFPGSDYMWGEAGSDGVFHPLYQKAPGGILQLYTRAIRVDLGGPPAAPTNLAATVASSWQINLSWADNSNNEGGFKIERKRGATGSYVQVGTAGANATSYNDAGLTAGVQYFYRVRAANGAGNSAWSNEANGTTPASGTLPTVTVTAADNSATETGPDSGTMAFIRSLIATDLPLTVNFTVSGTATSGSDYQPIGTSVTIPAGSISGTVTVTPINDATPEKTEKVTVTVAANPSYMVGTPNAASVSIKDNDQPAAPSNLTATAVSGARIDLAWKDNSTNETGFKIERKTGATGTYAQIATTGANVTTYSDTTVSPAAQYYYRVRAYNIAGNSSWSNQASATTP